MHFFTIIHLLGSLVFISCNKQQAVVLATQMGTDTTTVSVQTLPVRNILVHTATELKAALSAAKPGDNIQVADGIYIGKFVIPASATGTLTAPIVLRGSSKAVLDAGSITTGYVLHMQSSYWIVKGLSITNGLKGIMLDGGLNNRIDSVKIYGIGEEGIHLRKFSSHNTIINTEITNVGLKTPGFGEGIYIGSAKSNWATYTNGDPDLCDSNLVINNKIGPGITADCIDVKEGTTGGIIRGNYFDATGIAGANSGDSWLDVKGNYYLIENNYGYNPAGSFLTDGYQVNVAVSGWGCYNSFINNNSDVNAPGYGFNIRLSSSNGTAVGNKVYANNIVTGAAKGISNISLTQ